MGYDFAVEHIDFGLLIDVYVPDLSVAIELDGPTHFARNRPGVKLGPTVFKHCLLEDLGCKVISIQLAEWNKLGNDSRGRRHLLEAAIVQTRL